MPKIGNYAMQKTKFRVLHGIVAEKSFPLSVEIWNMYLILIQTLVLLSKPILMADAPIF